MIKKTYEKQALNHNLLLERVNRMIDYYQDIELDTKFRRSAKTDYEKEFFKLMKIQCLTKP